MHPARSAAEISADVLHVSSHGVLPFHSGSPNRHLFVPRIIVSGLRELFAIAGHAVSNQVSAAGGVPPYTWSATGLPHLVTINPTTGLISGHISNASYTVTVTATDATGRTGTATATWRGERICRMCRG
jgi:hypothetical protein